MIVIRKGNGGGYLQLARNLPLPCLGWKKNKNPIFFRGRCVLNTKHLQYKWAYVVQIFFLFISSRKIYSISFFSFSIFFSIKRIPPKKNGIHCNFLREKGQNLTQFLFIISPVIPSFHSALTKEISWTIPLCFYCYFSHPLKLFSILYANLVHTRTTINQISKARTAAFSFANITLSSTLITLSGLGLWSIFGLGSSQFQPRSDTIRFSIFLFLFLYDHYFAFSIHQAESFQRFWFPPATKLTHLLSPGNPYPAAINCSPVLLHFLFSRK